MTTWLLLSLLTVQTVTGRGLRQRDFNDARDTLREELEDLVPKQLPAGKHDIEHLTVLQTFPSVCEHLGLAHFLPCCTAVGNIQELQKTDGGLSGETVQVLMSDPQGKIKLYT